MKTFKTQCAQGDVLITRLSGKPVEVRHEIPAENGQVIVTHSETGHHHVMDPARVQAFAHSQNPLVIFLLVKEPAELTHLREIDTHESIHFDPGWYQVNRQREFDYNATERAQYRRALD